MTKLKQKIKNLYWKKCKLGSDTITIALMALLFISNIDFLADLISKN